LSSKNLASWSFNRIRYFCKLENFVKKLIRWISELLLNPHFIPNIP
jgi:hypothetical protein